MTVAIDRTNYDRARELPNNLEAEQALLGAILVNNAAIEAIPPTFQAEFFGEEIHQKIFRAMTTLRAAGRTFNPVTIKTMLNDVDIVRGVTLSQYTANLAAGAISVVNVPDFAWATTEASVRRGLEWLSSLITRAAYDRELSLVDEIDAARSCLDELSTRLSGTDAAGSSGSDALDVAFARMERATQGHDDVGIDCGLEPVRQLIGKMTGGQLVVIGGGTKQGKSGLARQLGLGAARTGVPCFDYSGEMDAYELAMREVSRITNISVARQKEGDVSPHEVGLIKAAKNELKKLPWRIVDRRRSLEQFGREFESFVKRNGQTVGIVDSVTLFDTDRATQRLSKYEFAEYATDKLKAIARDTGSVIIALSQLKKNTFVVERQYGKKIDVKTYRNVVSRRPRASDLYGACERDADHVLIPFNPMPILKEIEPAEGSDEHMLWEDVVSEFKGRAEIILALSRERTPSRREVRWDGTTTSYLPKNEYQQGRMAL